MNISSTHANWKSESGPVKAISSGSFPPFAIRGGGGGIGAFLQLPEKLRFFILRHIGLRFQCSRAPKRANKASWRTDPLCGGFGEYKDVDPGLLDVVS